uniref:Pentacotripeptide-repeat region of PRORP domain-containing protein n=1 Tax=Oryza barthii TaxID=65489 RepID=A0A0D3GKA0_9ORYZ
MDPAPAQDAVEMGRQGSSAVSSSPSLPHLRHLHALAVRLPLPATSLPFLLSRLLRRLAALPPPPHAPLPYALNVFSAVSPPDPFLAAALLRFAFLTQPPLLPFRVFSHLRRAHGAELPFLPFAFSTLAKSATASRSLPAAAAAHAVSVLVGGFDRHRFVENSLIGAYVACGDVGAARKVFDEMVEKDVISWTSIVVAYTRSGDMRSAEEVFGRCPVKDMVAWTAMVTGYAQNAMPVKALEVFDRLAELGMVIDEVSLTGMVGEGRYYFAQMKDKYGIMPSVDHYACMVDLLGRAGLVDEALDLVRSMSVTPHGGVWGALLGACRIHGKSEIAKTMKESDS